MSNRTAWYFGDTQTLVATENREIEIYRANNDSELVIRSICAFDITTDITRIEFRVGSPANPILIAAELITAAGQVFNFESRGVVVLDGNVAVIRFIGAQDGDVLEYGCHGFIAEINQ